MKVKIIILLLLFSPFSLCRNSKVFFRDKPGRLKLEQDSLDSYIKTAALFRNTDKDSSIKYLNLSLNIARKINDFREQSRILSELISVYSEEGSADKIPALEKETISVNKHLLNDAKGKEKIKLFSDIASGFIDVNNDSALYYYTEVISLSKDYNDLLSEAEANLNIGYVYSHIEDNSTALDYFRKAEVLFKKVNNKKGTARSYQAISKVFIFFGNAANALTLEKEAAENYSEIKDMKGYYTAMRHIGEIYLSTGDYKKSLNILSDAVQSARLDKDNTAVSSLYQSLGNYYISTGNYAKAIEYLKKGLNIRKEGKEPVDRIINNCNSLGDAYKKAGDYRNSLVYYLKAIKLTRKLNNLILLSRTQENLGVIYSLLGNYSESIIYLKKSIANAQLIGNRYSLLGSYSSLSNVYEKMNNYRDAQIFYSKYSVLKDSIDGSANLNKIAQYKNIYEKENKAKEIEILKTEDQKIVLISIIVITFLSLIVLLVLLSRYKMKSRSNRLLVEKNDKITDMLAEVNELNEALKLSEATYRNLFGRNPMPMMIWEDTTGKIIAINDAAVTHYGYTEEEFLAMTVNELNTQQDIRREIKISNSNSAIGGRIPNIKQRKKNGDSMDVEIIPHPFIYEGTEAYSVMIQDVTERKAAERAVLESEERYRNLFEGSPDAVILIDYRLRIVKDANSAAAVLFRCTWVDLIGTPYSKLFSPSDSQNIDEFIFSIDQNQFPEMLETEVVAADGTKVQVEISGVLVSMPGFKVYQINIRDITSRKKTERRPEGS